MTVDLLKETVRKRTTIKQRQLHSEFRGLQSLTVLRRKPATMLDVKVCLLTALRSEVWS